jgi:hypothetical protein
MSPLASARWSTPDTADAVRAEPSGRREWWGGGGEPHDPAGAGEGAQPVDVRGPEGGGLADLVGPAAGAGDLQADGEVAGREPEADRDAVGVQAVGDQVVQVGPVERLLDRLLDPPSA